MTRNFWLVVIAASTVGYEEEQVHKHIIQQDHLDQRIEKDGKF